MGEVADEQAAISSGDLQRLAMRGSMWTAVHAVTAVPIAFVANAVVARALGVDDYGVLAVLTIAFTLATQVANAGFSDAVLRNGADSEARGDAAGTNLLMRQSLGFHLMVELPLLWAFAAVVSRDHSWVVLVVLMTASFSACAFGGATLFLTLSNRAAASAQISMASNLAVQVAVAVTALLTHDPLAVMAARLLSVAAAVPLFLFRVPRERRSALLRPLVPRRMPPGFWRFAGQSFLVGIIGLLVFSRSEILLLGWLGSTSEVGLFALAFGLSVQLTAPVDAMLNPLAPAVTGVLSTRPELARDAFLRAMRFSSLLCALITGILIPAVFFIIRGLYGADFADARVIFLPLAAISCVQSMGHIVTAFAFARQHGGRLLRVNAVGLAVNATTGVPLVFAFGVWGAVVTNILAQLTTMLLLARSELPLLEVSWWTYLGTMRIWLFSLGTGLFVTLGWAVVLEDNYPVVAGLAAVVTGVVLVLALARVTRSGLSHEDLAALLDASPRRARPVLRTLARPFLHTPVRAAG